MKLRVLICSILVFCCSAFSLCVDEVLLEKSRAAGEGEFLPLLVAVERAGTEAVSSHAKQLPMELRREWAVQELKLISETAQAPVLRELFEMEREGVVRNIRPMWIGGSIAFDAASEAFQRIMGIPGIAVIVDNSPAKITHSAESPTWPIFHESPSDAMEDSYALQQVKAPKAWAMGITGERVIVGVLDSGVSYTHTAIVNRMWTNAGEIPGNSADDDMNGYVDDYYGFDFVNSDGDPWDDNGHGTQCAGLVAGDGNGVVNTGVAPGAKIMALKVIDSSGSGIPADVSYAVQYAIEMGAHVLSISLGWSNPANSMKNYFRPIFEDVLAAGLIAAVSAGNGSGGGGHYGIPQDISSPADCPSPSQSGASSNTAVVAVGAMNFNASGIADFSSRGPTHWNTGTYSDFPYAPGLIKPELTAPGSYVRTISGGTSSTSNFTGTSASCPMVAGAMALVLSKNPSLSPEQVDSLLRATATDFGPAGHDTAYGAGMLNCSLLVASTPLPTFPILTIDGDAIDDSPPVGNGTGVFDAGETVRLIVDVYNRGAPAVGVIVNAAMIADPYISISDGVSNYGSIATGETKNNTGDPLTIAAASSTPPAHTAEIQLTITSGAYTYVETVQVKTGIYPRNYANHTNAKIKTTITNFGSFGYFDPTAPTVSLMGKGFAVDDTNTLYGGGFFVGIDYESVMTYERGHNSELVPIQPITMEATPAETSLYTTFAVPGTGMRIGQKSTTFNSPSNEDFIILRYNLMNRGSTALSGIYLGFYLDFDIHYEYISSALVWHDRAMNEPSDEWVYMWDGAATPRYPGYVGIVGLTGLAHSSVVENAVHVYPEGMGWTDTVKYNFMAGVFSKLDGSPGGDWSVVVSEGPLAMLPGENYTWAIAVVAGSDLADFENNAETARTTYGAMNISERGLPEKLGISAYPNPFNSAVKIFVEGAGIGYPNESRNSQEIAVEVFDISGRCVDVVMSSNAKGYNKDYITWTPAEEVPSGVYLVRVRTEDDRTAERRIVLLK